MKVVYYYIEKESERLQSRNHNVYHNYSCVVSLQLGSKLKEISRYEAHVSDSVV
jgi:hypothetical protein